MNKKRFKFKDLEKLPPLSEGELKELFDRFAVNADRLIEAHQLKGMGEKTDKRGRKPNTYNNPDKGLFRWLNEEALEHLTNYRRMNKDKDDVDFSTTFFPTWFDDVITGIVRLDYHGEGKHPPLSIRRLMDILTTLDNISTRDISNLLNIGRRQAERYASAARLVIHHTQSLAPQSAREEAEDYQIWDNWEEEDFDVFLSVE